MEMTQYKDFWAFLRLLADNALLEHVVVIGSWAEYLYAQSGLLPGFEANLRTLDIDFLVKNLRRPMPKANLATLAREAGYTVEQDYITETTKIYTPGFMEIEFLILQRGAGDMGTLKTNLGVNAQALRHVASLKEFTETVHLFDMDILVPQPEAYALHKMVINTQRGNKAEKDREAIANLLPYLDMEKLRTIHQTLTKKERGIADAFFADHTDILWS